MATGDPICSVCGKYLAHHIQSCPRLERWILDPRQRPIGLPEPSGIIWYLDYLYSPTKKINNNTMKYEVWSVSSLSTGEPMRPLLKIFEADNFEDAFVEFRKLKGLHVIFVKEESILDSAAFNLGYNVAGKMREPLNLDAEDTWIYESPDKGKTVYRRRPGSSERELIDED